MRPLGTHSCFLLARAQRPKPRALLLDLAQLLDCADLRDGARKLGLRFGELDLARAIAERFFGALLCLKRGSLIEVVRAKRRVGENGHEVRLHFEGASGYEEEMLFARWRLDAHFAGLQGRQ